MTRPDAICNRPATQPTRFASNPFVTRRIRPGAIPFHFPPGSNAASLVARLAELGWWAAIVGPHGSGKSTLLAALREEVERAGRDWIAVALHNGQRQLPRELLAARRQNSPALVVVDGYEQLNVWSRWRLARHCRRTSNGLLVTSHGLTHLPTLFRTEVSLETAERIVAELLAGRRDSIRAEDVRRAFMARGGNLRETLFDLYDLHELRWRLGDPRP